MRFIGKNLPDCKISECPFDRECNSRFLLLDSGSIVPFKEEKGYPIPDHWVSWPRCPRLFLGRRYMVDQGIVSISEALRWAFEMRAHRSHRLSCRGQYLIREWSRIREYPGLLADHIAYEKWKAKHGVNDGG